MHAHYLGAKNAQKRMDQAAADQKADDLLKGVPHPPGGDVLKLYSDIKSFIQWVEDEAETLRANNKNVTAFGCNMSLGKTRPPPYVTFSKINGYGEGRKRFFVFRIVCST